MSVAKDKELCRLVDDCPLLEDCLRDTETAPSSCPMKKWSYDLLLCEPPRCTECESLSQFEEKHGDKMTNQDTKDLSLYWMEHLNRHLEKHANSRIKGTESNQH